MKPYPNYRGNNLTAIKPRAIAFVTEGANRKKFFLLKLKDEGVSMKKETALALIKGGNLSPDEMKSVLESVADADKVEVQKAIDEQKKTTEGVDVKKLAESVASEIVKAIEPKLSGIADSLKKTTESLEKLIVAKKTDEDPELSDEDAEKLINDTVGKEGDK